FALCETGRTSLRPSSLASIRAVTASLLIPGSKSFEAEKAGFLRADPRIALFPVPASFANDPSVRPFETEDNPLRFPTAVVVTSGGEEYGEAPIRVMSGTSRYVEVQNSLANVLFGSFSPSEGDLVFSMNGKLIGFMVSSGRALVLKEVASGGEIGLGAAFDPARAAAVGATLADRGDDTGAR
ncbi:MAG TPA: hypothetical protein PKI32_09690, partial [Opitutales bacterium]|nr:hypothetical protein [Opitutales bacterium]